MNTGDGDGRLETGKWITHYDGNTAAVQGLIREYVHNKTLVAILVFDITNDELEGVDTGGHHIEYQSYTSIKVILRGFSLEGSNEDIWIMFELISAGINCGLPKLN
jgi:hypothetical protein